MLKVIQQSMYGYDIKVEKNKQILLTDYLKYYLKIVWFIDAFYFK